MTSTTLPKSLPTPQTRLRRFALVMLYGLCAIWGVVNVLLPDDGTAYLIASVLFASFATIWAAHDAKIRGRKIPHIVWIMFFLVWPVASLLYLFWTRKFGGVGWWILNVFGLMATSIFCFYSAFFLLYWLGMIDLNQFSIAE